MKALKQALIILCAFGGAARPLAAAPAGWKFQAGKPGKPAVLLIHGLAASRTHWTSPQDTWSIKHLHFDHRKKVDDRTGDKAFKTVLGKKVYEIKAGIESVRLSAQDDAGKEQSFWNYLVSQGYTVATWNQAPCMDTDKMPSQACKDGDTFAPALASAKEALAELAKASKEPIALLGHSRGGLIARALLKDASQPGRERVKWLITLHSPHQGSSMASLGVGLQKALDGLDGAVDLGFLPDPLQKTAKALLPDLGGGLNKGIDALVAVTGMEGARELAANGAVLQGLSKDEAKPAGLRVVTVGGTSPKVAEAWLFLYDAASADPAKKGWHADAHKILDFPGAGAPGFPELKEGGDLLVTDAASQLPWEDRHISDSLNHAEVLWDRGIQKEVDAELSRKP